MTEPREPFLEASDVTILRDGRPVVERASFRVARGSIHVLMGPNGGGKSSVVEAILGRLDFRGTLRLHVAGTGRVGYVPQGFPVDPTLPITVLELLALSRQGSPVCLGITRGTRRSAEAVLARVGLAGFAERRLGALSGGELRRVLLAQAIDPAPELLLLDEPAAGLDAPSVERLEELVREVRDHGGATVVMVSHDREQVRRVADAVTWIEGGVRRDGSVEAVLAEGA